MTGALCRPLVQPFTPGVEPPNKGPESHLIDDSGLHDRGESWVLCDCGARVRAENAAAVAIAFEAHRRGSGLPPVNMTSERERTKWFKHHAEHASA